MQGFDLNKRMMIFAPHPDDETFGCGGTIVKRLTEGYEVFIVVSTDGRHAFLNVLGLQNDPTPEELKLIRRKEIFRASRKLGVPSENLVLFDYEDGTLREHEAETEKKVSEMLNKYLPTEVYFPHEKDANVDHQAANRVVRRSIEKTGLSPSRYEYSISQRFSRIGPLVSRLLNLFRHNLVFVDVSEFLPVKEAAMKEFKSEIEALSHKQKRPVIKNFRKFLKSKEIFYL